MATQVVEAMENGGPAQVAGKAFAAMASQQDPRRGAPASARLVGCEPRRQDTRTVRTLQYKENYKGRVVIDKPLEIGGDGKWGGVVIEAWTLPERRLEMEGCDVTSRSFACVAIHGGADQRLPAISHPCREAIIRYATTEFTTGKRPAFL